MFSKSLYDSAVVRFFCKNLGSVVNSLFSNVSLHFISNWEGYTNWEGYIVRRISIRDAEILPLAKSRSSQNLPGTQKTETVEKQDRSTASVN